MRYEDGLPLPSHGILGIVPQKNVLFPELTCFQTVRVWRAIKRPEGSPGNEDISQLLRDCDLGHKIHSNASTLSGGQKRKLQLAAGLVGGSKSTSWAGSSSPSSSYRLMVRMLCSCPRR